MFSWLRSLPSWNNHKLAELAREEGSSEFRQRASRLDKWRQVALDAGKENNLALKIPDKIEFLVYPGNS